MMESILSRGTEYVPKMGIGLESQQDEEWEQRWIDTSDEVSGQEVWSQQAAWLAWPF